MIHRFVSTILSSLFIAFCTIRDLGAHTEAPNDPLNIVVIMVDDLGWTDLGCYGSDFHETPNIDALARQSVTFTNAYAAAGICSPTRAAYMTGKHPVRLGMTIWHEAAVRGPDKDRKLVPPETVANLPREEVTLAERLGEAGYRTFHVGKWHLGDAAHYPETQGFDVNIGGTHWGAPASYFWPFRGPFDEELRYVPGLHEGKDGDYLTDHLTSQAVTLLRKHRAVPFFLSLCFHTVHTPIEGKPDLVGKYEGKRERSDPKRHRHAGYAAMVESLDENVGRILRELEALQLSDRTLVILTSDNGGVVHETRAGVVTTNAPLRSGKGSLYEGGVRVPLVIRRPGLTDAGDRCEAMVATQDLYPTILELAGVSLDEEADDLDGHSFVAQLKNPDTPSAHPFLAWHYPHYYPTTTPVSAIRRGSHKLLVFYEDSRRELYDLAADPSETIDLAGEKPELVESLHAMLQAWLAETGARFPKSQKR